MHDELRNGPPEEEPSCEVQSNSEVEPIFQQLEAPLFLELCSGCGIPSSRIKGCVFDILPIDCKRNKHKTRVKTFCMDLSNDHAWEVLRYIVENSCVAVRHIASPCGTCTRAREIPTGHDHGPPPLKTAEYPFRVPGMSLKDIVRVEAANKLYFATAEFCEWLDTKCILWTIENPTRSWLWMLPCMSSLVNRRYMINFHSCAFGGKRFKKTSFWTNHQAFRSFAREWQGDHPHADWGYDAETKKFATAEEAEYPAALCKFYARVLTEVAAANGRPPCKFSGHEDNF